MNFNISMDAFFARLQGFGRKLFDAERCFFCSHNLVHDVTYLKKLIANVQENPQKL